ncbi:hypothetical protein ATE40_021240 [Serratia surfactantfaciens]|uniref:hypothetical protein n=1 Tax=Serratia surfactantfaciens TaxID=2741499 RepID=UPI0007C81997|nr:hypothetical protein [Serratia surfactantfaciens]AOF01650.1 hypothetical protein ATE40_021240 [Serratia surfactantfaciens]
MNYERNMILKRMEIKSSLELAGDNPMLVKEYLSTFPLPILRRVLIYINMAAANSAFPKIADSAPKLIDFIFSGVISEEIKSSFNKIDKLVKAAEGDIFSEDCIAWLKNDIEACHYFWWGLIHLEWKGLFNLLRADNIHCYSGVEDKQREVYVSDTFGLPWLIAGHKERYKSILMLLNLLPFKNTEINILVSHLSYNYKKCKEICKGKVNITSLIKNKESVSFSISYLKKKNIFLPDLESLTELDNKYALITQLYLLSGGAKFKELVTSLTKAWSQKKVREKRKEADKKQPAEFPSLSKESIRMLKLLSKKHSMSHAELMDLAVLSLFEELR